MKFDAPLCVVVLALLIGDGVCTQIMPISRKHISQPSDLSFTTIQAEFNETYNNQVNIKQGFIYEYHFEHTQESAVRITTTISDKQENQTSHFPLQIVVRQQLAVQSWNLPLELNNGIKFKSVHRTLCSTAQDLNVTLPMSIEATSFSPTQVAFSIKAEIIHNLTVSIGPHYNIYLTPSSPVYYQYTFDNKKDFRSVNLYISSQQDYYCSNVIIQQAKCPVQDSVIVSSSSEGIIYQSFLKSAAIIIDKEPDSDSVYIVFSVSPSDQACAKTDRILPIGAPKLKHVEFWIESHIEDSVYILAISGAIGYCALFYICFLTGFIVRHCWNKRCPSSDEPNQRELRNADELAPALTSPVRGYGSVSTNGGATASPDNEFESSTRSAVSDADHLEDIDDMKDVYRLKVNLMVSDMARKDPTALRKKYMLYTWNVVIISIFYGLPVIQLVFTYQRLLNLTGNQDTCYYNFLCSRKLGVLHSFNNVFSNLGYIMLGILFIIITYIRQRQNNKLSEEYREKFGIPQHLGLFYAMGWALCVEGVMSGCYHVCPSYNNFQFDTAFMYILGSLLMLRLFQSRHPDINANAHKAYLCFAVLIILAVFGVLYNTEIFWVVFTILHVFLISYLCLQIYYVGRFKFDRSLLFSLVLFIKSDCCRLLKPLYPARLGLLVFIYSANMGLALYGVITTPADFATHMLAIIIMNLMSYCMFYITMKCVHKEGVPPQSIVLIVIAAILWGFALWFFTHSLTDWQVTPAMSRNLNAPCIILDFFDGHDVWHFLSAGALFCTFLVVFFIDDNVKNVPRDQIPVF